MFQKSRGRLFVTGLLGSISSAFIPGVSATGAAHSTSQLHCVRDAASAFITTLNVTQPHAQCFRVENGLFTEIFTEKPSLSSGAEQISYLDGFVLPGIIESHGHMLQYGEMLESVPLYGVQNIEEARSRIKTFLKHHEGEGYGQRDKWIRGIGWDQAFFGGVMPTADQLSQDSELKDLYMMLDRVDVHCVWVSTPVLSLMPTPLPESPPGGVVVTDPGPGVFCDNAMDEIIFPLAPKPSISQRTRWFKLAMEELNKVGIVGVGDAGMRPADVQILESLALNGELTTRISVMLECKERNTFCPEEILGLKLLYSPSGMGGDTLKLGGVKLFADGALGSWGAALLEPYTDKPEISGTMLINETDLTRVTKQWFDAGFQVNIHAIGDRANRAAVDAFEAALGPDCNACNSERRLRIEHAQIIHPDDQKRIARMGIIPSIQPTHATSDMAYALDRLGPERLSNSAYRMASFFPKASNGSASSSSSAENPFPGPVLGSDFPVEPPNPFHGMYAAVTRLNPATGTSPAGEGGWHPEQKLSVEQALKGFTKNGAYGWIRDDKAGTIEVGKWADWVVVDRDIFQDESGKGLRDVVVRETWVGGRRVYGGDGDIEEEVRIPLEIYEDVIGEIKQGLIKDEL
ncbi:amidohydrolase family-domain-containing protein [Xylogone sp. PMI_703]|nr:amidohydrolase family-domain-containing protein [Xylogone sp. PMI_703]